MHNRLRGALGFPSTQSEIIFETIFGKNIATTVIIKWCYSKSPYLQMMGVVDTKTARETARCAITGVFNLQFAENLS